MSRARRVACAGIHTCGQAGRGASSARLWPLARGYSCTVAWRRAIGYCGWSNGDLLWVSGMGFVSRAAAMSLATAALVTLPESCTTFPSYLQLYSYLSPLSNSPLSP